MSRSARLFNRVVPFLLACALLQAPVSGAAQSSPPNDPTSPPPAPFFGLEAPEGVPDACFSNYSGGAGADFSSFNAQAVQNAINAAPAGGTVKLAGVCAGVVSYGGSSQVGQITKTLTVIGGYAQTNWVTSYPITQPTILDAQNGGRVLQITAGGVTISDLIAQNGRIAGADGGGILSSGALTLTNVTIYSSTTDSDGGGVMTSGPLRLIDTRLISNTAGQSGGGATSNGFMTLIGGLFERNVSQHGGGARAFGSLSMTGTQFINNRSSAANFSGGGLKGDAASTLNGGLLQGNSGHDGGGFSGEGTALISGTQFISNTAARWGGGAFLLNAATLTGTQFLSNTAATGGGGAYTLDVARILSARFQGNVGGDGGGIQQASGALEVLSSTLAANKASGGSGYGGGINHAAMLTVTDSTIFSNSANFGGGIAGGGSATALVRSSTLYSNVASVPSGIANGGAIYVYGALGVVNSTFVSNSAATSGGAIAAASSYTLTNSTVTRNTAGIYGGLTSDGSPTLRNTIVVSNAGGDCIAAISADAFNLDGDGSCGGATTRTAAQINLQSLADNGGGTPTMALGPSSAAINAGSNAVCPAADQRGVARPQAGVCDAGAYEAPGGPNVCFANYSGGAGADFSSSDSQAVQNAIHAASAGGTIKLAGVCAGTVLYNGTNQIGLITKTLNLIGGYTVTNWAASYPITQPTILDAQYGGRAVQITGVPVSVFSLTVQFGKAVGEDGGGIRSNNALTLTGVTVYSSTTDNDGGGVATSGVLRLIDTRLISNTAGQSAGGARAGGTLILIGGLFERNVAQHGGGARVFGSAVMTGTQFIDNRSRIDNFSGGGLKVDGASTLNGGLFQGNIGYDGGGLSGQGTASISGTQFISNMAMRWGGGANVNLLTQITATTFTSNTSGSDCGALRTANILRATASAFYTNTTIFNGGAVCADSGAIAAGGVFQNNTGAKGGALWTNGSTTLSNVAFLSNTATGAGGGGAFLENGAAALNGGVFQANRATSPTIGNAGGLYAASLSMTGTLLISNTAANNGGGVYAAGPATINGAQFTGNEAQDAATGNGGGIYANAALTATGAQFVSNLAGYGGGGAYGNGQTQIFGGVFRQNSAPGYGGGGLNAGNAASISGTQFLTNSGYYGGAIYAGGAVWMTGGLLAGNSAVGSGGGADLEGGGAITGTRIQDNRCGGCGPYGGGGVWSVGDLRVTAARFAGNSTGSVGGGLAFGTGATAGSLIIVNTLFAANVAPAGAAIAVGGAASAWIVHTTIASPTLASGSAIDVASSTANISNTIVASHALGINGSASTVAENYNLFFGNTTNTAGAITGGMGSGGGDPRFVDPAAGDYHLTALSAARNTGVNAGVAVDFDGDPRPIGGGFDIGYDETRSGGVFVPSVLR